MSHVVELQSGRWWRFSRYEIAGGCVIPARGAELQAYDAWESHRVALRQKSSSPYQSLLTLAGQLKLRPSAGGRVALTRDSLSAITSWCANHGLLGILLQRATMVTLPATWESLPAIEVVVNGRRTSALSPTVRRYLRTPNGWQQSDTTDLPPLKVKPAGMLGRPVSSEELPDDLPRPGALLQRLTMSDWEMESLDETWARFFPHVSTRAGRQFPLPLTDEFWRAYAEPVDSFVEGALALRRAVESVRPSPHDPTSEDIGALRTLVASTSPVLYRRQDGSLGERWVAPSLLGMFARMASLDIAGGAHVFKCEACQMTFVSKAYQAKYHSPTCRERVKKRAQRAKSPVDKARGGTL